MEVGNSQCRAQCSSTPFFAEASFCFRAWFGVMYICVCVLCARGEVWFQLVFAKRQGLFAVVFFSTVCFLVLVFFCRWLSFVCEFTDKILVSFLAIRRVSKGVWGLFAHRVIFTIKLPLENWPASACPRNARAYGVIDHHASSSKAGIKAETIILSGAVPFMPMSRDGAARKTNSYAVVQPFSAVTQNPGRAHRPTAPPCLRQQVLMLVLRDVEEDEHFEALEKAARANMETLWRGVDKPSRCACFLFSFLFCFARI